MHRATMSDFDFSGHLTPKRFQRSQFPVSRGGAPYQSFFALPAGEIVGARGRRLVAGRQQEIGLLHRRSTAREIFALDANALAQLVAGVVLHFETGLRRIRSNNMISCSSAAADGAFSHSYPKFAALLEKFFLPSHQFAGAIYRDRGSPLLGGMLSLLGGPRSVLDPAGRIFDQPPIPRRAKRRARRRWPAPALPSRIDSRAAAVCWTASSRPIATSRSRTAPSWACSHFSSALICFRWESATIGEKNEMAVRKRASATRI